MLGLGLPANPNTNLTLASNINPNWFPLHLGLGLLARVTLGLGLPNGNKLGLGLTIIARFTLGLGFQLGLC